MNNKPTYLSKDGLEKLRAELEEMTNVRRPEIADRIHDAKEHGDLTENAEYEDAKNEQAFVEGRIQTLEALIKNAVLIDENHSTDHVQIGSTVSVESEDGKETFTIVGSAEAKPAEGRISNESPVGRSLLGRKKGEKVVVKVPAGDFTYKITEHQLRGAVDWADELAQRVRDAGPQVVNDSKTPSGTVHVGSLRGPVILDAITRALRANGIETTLLYGVDDLDPMDAQALLTPDAVEPRDGPSARARPRPGRRLPRFLRAPPRSDVHRHVRGSRASIPDRYYWMSEHYAAGDMDPFIRTALDRAALVREIYKRVANVQHPDTWHPISVICPNCGKVGTTIVTEWDGERVFYECRPDLVTWARGCGQSGWVSPFGGNAKLPWNLEWAAQWSLFGVTIEPNGKDLATAGGSRDRSEAIAREVFEREPPLNIPYEFLNVGGRKMSTSKGRGAAAHTIAEVVPPEQLRFLFLRPRPNHAIDFDPEGTDADPAALRRVRQVRGGDRGTRGPWRVAARI